MNKQEVFNINGMMRDLGNSKSSPKYAYDIMNMRLFNFEENTAGNLCNDYGNHFLPVVDSEGDYYDVLGQTVGICKINANTIIIFTAGASNSYIYKGILKVDNSALECALLYLGDLKFNTNHPIESLYNYENEKSLKIYWTDGKNPLRLINLAADSETMSSWIDSSFLFNPYLQLDEIITVNKIAGGGLFHAGTVQYAFTYYNLYGPESAIFYNTPLYYASPDDRGGAADEIINCSFNINIKSFDRSFDFLRVYAIQRTSINGTPVARKVSDIVIPKTEIIAPLLYANELYFTYQDLLNNSVTLTDINDNDLLNAGTTIINDAITSGSSKIYRVYGSSYKKLKINDYTMYISDDEIYTITWVTTNLNGNALVLITNNLGEVAYKKDVGNDSNQLNIIDDGILGEAADYTSLLYKGGEEITAQTLDSKDNTLFLGNISLKKPSLLNLNVDGVPLTDYAKTLSVEFNYNGNKTLPSPTKNSFYPYINLLRYNSELIKHFKQGSVYRLGFLAQYQDGSWSTVIYIKDVLNDKPIKTTFYEDGEFQFPTPEVILTPELMETLLDAGYKRVRPVVAFSNLPQWSFLGVVNPTMYKIDSRAKNTLFSQASWFYRPSSPYDYSRTVNVSLATEAPYQVDVFDIDTAIYGYDENNKRGVLEKWGRLKSLGLDIDVDYKASRFFTLTGLHHTIANSVLNDSLKLVNKLWAEYGADIEFRHGQALNGNLFKKSEIQCLSNIDKYKLSDTGVPSYIPPFKNVNHTDQVPLDTYLDNYDQTYIIDQSIFNIDSPDLNFDSILNRSLDNSKFRIVGAIPMTTNYSAYDIMIDGTTTPYTWNSLDGSSVKEKDTVWAPPHTINEYMLRKVLPENIGSNPDVDEYPLIPRELAIRYPDGQVDLKLGTNLFSPQAWRTNSAVPIWQDNMVTASLFRNEVGINDGEWTAYTATAALYTNTHRTLFPDSFDAYFTIYPWHGRILNNYTTKLKTKILSNIKVSFKSIYLNNFYTDMLILSPSLFTSDLDIIKIQDYFGNTILYGGNVDQICSPKIDSDNLGYDITLLEGTNTTLIINYYGWGTFPAHVSWTRGKMLKKDFFSRYSDKPLTSVENEIIREDNINEKSTVGYNLRKMDGASANNYYRRDFMRHITSKDPVSIKYKTTKHLVITSKASLNPVYNIDEVEILPTIVDSRVEHLYSSYTGHPAIPQEVWVYRNWAVNQLPTNFYKQPQSSPVYYPFWSDSALKFKLNVIESSDLHGPAVTSKSILFGWLWLGELYNDIVAFPESSEESLELYIWYPCASPIKLVSNNAISMYYYEGDTYYQRYDSLKTYPYTKEDPNLVVDVVSFMCETTKNIDGRYDKNRNTTFTSTISPTNFNLINEVYSQPNNFFQQRYISKVQSAIDKFENAITWSLTKTNGEEIDSWTKLNLASVLDLDGDRGPVNKIKKFNNDLIAFQDSAIANILYNSNVQIASTTGVPIEISNSYKVDGKRYLSTNIGCKNKWSITETPSGLYFVDDLNKKLYLFQQGLKGISEEKGFNSWFHEQCNNNIWTPKDSLNFVTYFDNYYRELLLINKDNCLAFSEVSNEFTSFYSYEKTPYFTNLNKERLFIKYGNTGNSEFYLGNTTPDSSGTNKYFFEEKPVYVTLKIQSNPLMDKVFNGIEYRNEFYTADGEDNFITDAHMFDNLNIWTDYQSGTLDINKVVGLPSSLKLKFRINRVLLPRDTSNPNLIRRRDRIRNPWAFILLKADTNKAKFRIHDIVVNYTE